MKPETTKSPKPWSVYSAKLRPQFPTKIIEIHDARGEPVIAWAGFDNLNMSHGRKLGIARKIVEAVNARI